MKKRLKKKKISAKRKVRIMEQKCKILNNALEFQKEQIKRQHRIIRKLGSKDGYEFLDNLEDIEIETEEIKPETYGDYLVLCDDLEKETIEKCEDELVTSLVKGLMEANAVQFIVKKKENSYDPLNAFNTVAAKIRVIPWYEAVQNVPSDTEDH